MKSVFSAQEKYQATLRDLFPEAELPTKIGEIVVNGIALDSRKVQQGGLFIALVGARVDGRKFIPQVIENGVAAVFTEAEYFSIEMHGDVPVINVPSLLFRVGMLASRFYGKPSQTLDVIGVTGTNGKSTSVSLLAQCFTLLKKPAWQLGTTGYGNPGVGLVDTGLTTPDPISCQEVLVEANKASVEVVAMEVSSHAVVQHRISGIKFKGGVLTNVTHDHLDFHGSFESYRTAKKSFFKFHDMEFAIVNLDDSLGLEIASEGLGEQVKVISYSTRNSEADVFAEIETVDLNGMQGILNTPWGSGQFSTQLAGEFNLSNLLATISVMCEMGESFAEVLSVLPRLEPVQGRLQRVENNIEGADAPQVFVDYAHTPDALKNALSTMKDLTIGKLWVVFGCGGDRDKGKRSVMGEIASEHADCVVITSDNPRSEDAQKIIQDIEAGIDSQKGYRAIVDRREAIEFAIQGLEKNDCLLIAGKGHERYQLIGEKKLPFDDYLIARDALSLRHKAVTGEAT